MDKILRVDMTEQIVRQTAAAASYAGLGGRGITSKIVRDEVPPLCHALGAENKLVIAPGLLSGAPAACSGRLSVGAKSPLTGGIKESNAGGTAAQKLARLGVAALVIEGKPADGSIWKLVINKKGASLLPAKELKNANNYKAVKKLTEEYGEKASYITIGTGGERLMSAASIAVTDLENRPTRHAGRGGLGAVMGSKGLKVKRATGHHSRRKGNARRPNQGQRSLQKGRQSVYQGAERAPRHREGPANVRHKHSNQHSQRGRRTADPQLSLGPIRGRRQGERRNPARDNPEARRCGHPRVPPRLRHPLLPHLHGQEKEIPDQGARI
jgi:hypothetical protein